MEDPITQTYEQANAKKLNSAHTDPIHYDAKYSYRKSPYRFLNHQHGKIGTFTVRLLEGKNLKRRHWSVLGLGPMKHLGLSRAVGEVSSFATMRLHFLPRREKDDLMPLDRCDDSLDSSFNIADDPNIAWEESQSLASAVTHSTSSTSASASASAPFSPNAKIKKQSSAKPVKSYYSKEYRSSIVRSNSNPSWPTVQSPSNASIFEMDLGKGSMPREGMEIFLRVQMKEEVSAADSILPVKGGGNGILGEAKINLTPLVLRGFGSEDAYGSDEVDVWDEWVNLLPPQAASNAGNRSEDEPSKVRVLVSYEPAGFSPRRGDIVALESFARQPFATSSFRPILTSLAPMRVKDVRGEHLHCGFELAVQSGDGGNNGKHGVSAKEGAVRLHRNAVFVIERTNVIDYAVDVALKPTDVVLSTPIARDVTQTLSPYVESAGELLMPVFLSSKLFFEAAKVGGGAFAVGMKAALATVAANQNPEKRRTSRRILSSDDEF